ncbi:MAG TPA: TrmB family transcriptional regulator [Pseudomonadales bacterium]|nr:TrmB family transcriptional regulator [Pseudomonadales bacterium]
MIIHETLQHLGVSNKETDIYLALLKQGPCSIRDVASASGINRGTTYELLKSLKEKSLVSYFPKGKRRYFCAEPAESLLNIAQERQLQLNAAAELLQSEIVPDLQMLKPQFDSPTVRHYEGDDGVEYVLKDILRTVSTQENKEYRVYSSKLIRKYLYRPFPNFTRQRVQKNIYVNVIAIGEGGEDAPLANRKWIPAENINPGASYVAIYPPKCAMVSLTRGDYPTVVILDSDSIAQALKLSFDTLWERL